MTQLDPARVKVLIADDHPLVLAGIRRALERSEDIEVVGEATTGPQLLELIARRRPELVLVDLRMPGVTGTECIEEIAFTWPEVKIVVLSAVEDRASIDGALSAGASAYILKSVGLTDIAAILRQAARGSVFHAPTRGQGPPLAAEGDRGPALTEREQSILLAVADGLSTAAISRSLWISENTTKFHLKNIYRKLGVVNRAGAVRYALEHEMVAA
jgi:DNA-binding NarL/FixJ family response regulator